MSPTSILTAIVVVVQEGGFELEMAKGISAGWANWGQASVMQLLCGP